jgi:hypothetical protein
MIISKRWDFHGMDEDWEWRMKTGNGEWRMENEKK